MGNTMGVKDSDARDPACEDWNVECGDPGEKVSE